jgi:hypothetical protein
MNVVTSAITTIMENISGERMKTGNHLGHDCRLFQQPERRARRARDPENDGNLQQNDHRGAFLNGQPPAAIISAGGRPEDRDPAARAWRGDNRTVLIDVPGGAGNKIEQQAREANAFYDNKVT